MQVVGASTPVASFCEIYAKIGENEQSWRLRVDPAHCPVAERQHLWVPARDLFVPQSPRFPGDRSPYPGEEPSFEVTHVWPVEPPPTGYWASVARLRHDGENLARGDSGLAFVVAAVLGLPAALSPADRSALRRAGLGHLVAVSGMNIAVTAMLLQAPLLRVGLLCGGSLLLGCVLAWLPVAAYVGLTGAAAPAVRAAVMFVLVQCGVLLGRPAHGLTLLAVAAACLLAWRPAWAVDPGFHLSWAAMAVLLRPLPPGTAPPGLLAQSWHVTWATCPISLLHFDQATVWGVLSNLVAVPIFTLWIAPLGTLGSLLWPWLGPVALAPAAVAGSLVLDLAAVVARFPDLSPKWLAVAAAAALAVRWWHRDNPWLPGPWVCVATIAAVAAMMLRSGPTTPPAWFAYGTARMPMIIVPAGDAPQLACIREPNLPPDVWPRLLANLGYAGIAGVEARGGGHLTGLQAQWQRDDLWQPQEAACEFPQAAGLRAALRACRDIAGRRHVAARAGDECFVDGTWQARD